MITNTDEDLKAAEQAAYSVCTDEGVFYAQIPVPGQTEPLRIALHGVTTASQAVQALRSFGLCCIAG